MLEDLYWKDDKDLSGMLLNARQQVLKLDNKTITRLQDELGIAAALLIDKMFPGYGRDDQVRVQVCFVYPLLMCYW